MGGTTTFGGGRGVRVKGATGKDSEVLDDKLELKLELELELIEILELELELELELRAKSRDGLVSHKYTNQSHERK